MSVVLANAIFLVFTPLTALYAFLGLWNNPKKWRKFFPFFLVAIFVISYCYNPQGENVDLVRYLRRIKSAGAMTLSGALERYDDGLFIKTFIFWLAGKLGVPNFVQALSTTIVYGVVCYIVCTTAERNGIEKWIPFVLLAELFLLPYYSILNNVRNICSFSLLMLASYKDIIYKKRNFWVFLLYVISCFVHVSAIIIILFRVLVIVLKKPKIWMIFIAVLIPPMIIYAYRYVDFFSSLGSAGYLVRSLIIKAYNGLDPARVSGYEQYLRTSNYHILNGFCRLAFGAYLVCLVFRCKNVLEVNESRYLTLLYIIILTIFPLNVYSASYDWRFLTAGVIGFPVVLLPYIKRFVAHKSAKSFDAMLLYLIPIFAVGFSSMELFRSFSGSDYVDWISGVLQTNVYTIAFQIISGIFAW